jgi:flagellin
MATSEVYTIATTVCTVSGAGTMTMTTGNGSQTIYFTKPSGSATSDLFFASTGVTIQVNTNVSDSLDGAITAGSSGNASFQVGAANTSNDRITISLGNATNSGLGFGTAGVNLALDTSAHAQTALDSIDAAIASLNSVRGSIGAYMNRLSYASANLATTIENVTASESAIRDVDMASEMTTFTKNQILLQAGTAMLAQANQAPQQILSLFR